MKATKLNRSILDRCCLWVYISGQVFFTVLIIITARNQVKMNSLKRKSNPGLPAFDVISVYHGVYDSISCIGFSVIRTHYSDLFEGTKYLIDSLKKWRNLRLKFISFFHSVIHQHHSLPHQKPERIPAGSHRSSQTVCNNTYQLHIDGKFRFIVTEISEKLVKLLLASRWIFS